MASPPNRTDLAGTPTVATYKIAIGLLYDYVASLLGNGTATIATSAEQVKARESLGVGSFGFKNRLINPAFSVSQEFGTSSTSVTAGGAIKYVVDQWYASCTGANITAQLITGISDQKYSLRLTGASGNTTATLGQRIEGINCIDLKNQNIAVSFKSKASSNKTITWTAFYANSENVFSSKTSIASGTLNITTTVNDYSFSFNGGANAGNGIAIEFSAGALGSTETIDFDKMQFEKSAIATEFEVRSIENELNLCMRYYEKLNETLYGAHGTTAVSILYWFFKVRKFADPTVTDSGGAGNPYAPRTDMAGRFIYGVAATFINPVASARL